MATEEPLVQRVRPPAGGRAGADAALVLMHGRGTDANDLFPFLDFLDPQQRLLGVTVQAPIPGPDGGWIWYQHGRVGFPEPTTFTASVERLGATLDDLSRTAGLDASRIVLGGFSQGAVMAYSLGLGAGRPVPAGILALSGFMPTVAGFEFDLAPRRGLPVAIAHGSLDPIIPVNLGRAARDRLSEAGLAVEYHESAMGHTIDPRALPELQRWVAQRAQPLAAHQPSNTGV